MTPLGLLAHAKSEAGRRAIRYTCTSLIGVTITQVLLTIFLHLLDWKPVPANFVAVSITAVPAFILNKRWVWGKRGKAHMRREVIPFGVFTLAGWILSTVMVVLVTDATEGKSYHQIAIQGANIAGFGILWILKYIFLDKIMFGTDHHTPYDEDIEREEALSEAAPPTATADPAPVEP